ncbi:MAG: exo-alpha-sialidase [Planctomycetes bacterium]|nr:exo-alpha-sialidase [Planctomycetota bacterium]
MAMRALFLVLLTVACSSPAGPGRDAARGAGSATAGSAAEQAAPQRELVLFQHGVDGYPNYRIPAIARTARGVLLAFAEGRQRAHDHAENDLVLRRSLDDGATWQPVQVVAAAGRDCLSNPCAVALRSGRVLLVHQRYAQGFDEHAAEPGFEGPRVCRTFLQHSDDDGRTWSAPREITRSVKRAEATSVASGPGIGIELARGVHAGRVLVPMNQGPFGAWEVYAALSDDGGATWRMGQIAPGGELHRPNEVQFAERDDGSVLLDARGMAGAKRRKLAESHDGGDTWSAVRDVDELVEPRCMGALLRHAASGLLLRCGPRSESRRERGTVWASADGGATWPARVEIVAGSFAYSGLVELDGGGVGVVYEDDAVGAIRFLRLEAAALPRPPAAGAAIPR